MAAVTAASEYQSLWSCDASSLPLMSPTAAAMPGPTKDKHRHSWRKQIYIGTDGQLRGQAEMPGVSLAFHDPELRVKEHGHQNARQEGGCKVAPGSCSVAATWMNQVSHLFLAKCDAYTQC